MVTRRASRDRIHFNQMIADLTHDDPLKRLIAVRQLTDLVSFLQDDRAPRSLLGKKPSRRDVADYFRLMLSREREPIIREAVLDGLQTLDIVHQLKQATQPAINSAHRLTPAKTRRVSSARSLH
ncbi:MAG: hypothetical protein HC866_16745 [Leptolyngbyaceae cyanobacterium RU_5_1]|nr:hypothetical protein [Leptolyngbyaceae cyanobacterium RU_5_1]